MLVNAPLDLCRQVKNEQQAKLGDTLTASEPEDSTTVTPVIPPCGGKMVEEILKQVRYSSRRLPLS